MNFLDFFKNTVTSSNRDCFFKLVTCIEVTLKKLYNVCSEISTNKVDICLLENYLLIMKTISKLDKKNFTFDDVLNIFNNLPTTPSSTFPK